MKLFQKNKGNKVGNRGVALLIAVLIGSIAFVVGMGVYNRTYRELIFASFWKQAQIAFSAADSGLECAMYWDKNPSTSPKCFGSTIPGWNPTLSSYSMVFTTPVDKGCVTVMIIKPAPAPSTATIRIESRGHNNTCGSSSLREVERAVGVEY